MGDRESDGRPKNVILQDDGRVLVDVHQVVKDLAGAVLKDVVVQHLYTFDGTLIARMEILD